MKRYLVNNKFRQRMDYHTFDSQICVNKAIFMVCRLFLIVKSKLFRFHLRYLYNQYRHRVHTDAGKMSNFFQSGKFVKKNQKGNFK